MSKVSYVVPARARPIQNISGFLWEFLKDKYAGHLFGTWHIRRGDAKKYCDTSLERMEAYAECTFGPVKQNIVILLMTDERGKDYLEGFKKIFSAANQSNVELVFLDQLVQARMADLPDKYNNNYLIFEVGRALSDMASAFKIQHRRHFSCEACFDLRERLEPLTDMKDS